MKAAKWPLIGTLLWALSPWVLWAIYQFHKPDHADPFWTVAIPFIFVSCIPIVLSHSAQANWFPLGLVVLSSLLNLSLGLIAFLFVTVLRAGMPTSTGTQATKPRPSPNRTPAPPNRSTSGPPPLPSSQPPPIPKPAPPELTRVLDFALPTELSRWCRTDARFTRTGALLAVLTSIATATFAYFLLFRFLPLMSPHEVAAPHLAIVILVVGFGALFFAGAAWLTDKLGFPATKPNPNANEYGTKPK